MSVHEAPDGVGDEVRERMAGLVRTAVTLGGMAAEVVARERERQARIAEVAARDGASSVRGMYEAERAFAVGRLSTVVQDEWWDRATPGDVQLAWQDAAAWRDHDPRAAGYADRIRDQLMERYGVDPDATPIAEPADLAAARARRDRGAEQVEAVVTVQATQAAGQGPDPVSAGREVPSAAEIRQAWAASAERMHESGVPDDAAQARLLTDVARSRPPESATERAGQSVGPGRGQAPGRAPQRPRQRQPQQGVGR